MSLYTQYFTSDKGKESSITVEIFCIDRCPVLLLQQVGIKDKGYETAPVNFPRKCSIS